MLSASLLDTAREDATEADVGRVNIELFRIEVAANPIQQFLLSPIPGIPQCLNKVDIPSDSTDVFRRASPLATNADGQRFRWMNLDAVFKNDQVFPAITEVVLIEQPIRRLAEELSKGLATFIDGFVLEVRIRRPVALFTHDELMQVGVVPSKRCLQREMQLRQGDSARNDEPSPDLRLNTNERDLDGVGC